MAKSRGMSFDATPVTLLSDDVRNSTLQLADNDYLVLGLGQDSTSDSVCMD
jgi:hypothetical protein